APEPRLRRRSRLRQRAGSVATFPRAGAASPARASLRDHVDDSPPQILSPDARELRELRAGERSTRTTPCTADVYAHLIGAQRHLAAVAHPHAPLHCFPLLSAPT